MQQKKTIIIAGLAVLVTTFQFCSKTEGVTSATTVTPVDPYVAIKTTFGTNIDPNNLANYASQGRPNYIVKENTGANPITNAKATLGRVLFYDKN